MTDMDATEKREVIEGFLDHIDAMTERINHLHQRVTALEARTAETGLMGRVIRRVEALEDKSNYGSTVVNHEARLKALEAAREPAHAPEPEALTSLRKGLVQAGRGETHPIETLWERFNEPPPPAPETDTVTISRAAWDATQAHISYLVTTISDIRTIALNPYSGPNGALDAIVALGADVTDRQLAFEASLGM